MAADIGPFQDIVGVSWGPSPPTILVVYLRYPGTNPLNPTILQTDILGIDGGFETRYLDPGPAGIFVGTNSSESSDFSNADASGSMAVYYDLREVRRAYEKAAAEGVSGIDGPPDYIDVGVYATNFAALVDGYGAEASCTVEARLYNGRDAIATEKQDGPNFYDFRITNQGSSITTGFDAGYLTNDGSVQPGDLVGTIRVNLFQLLFSAPPEEAPP